MNFSIIIPTLNQSAKLKLCLVHLANLDFDPNAFEVLVIDNGSTDNTKDVTKGYAGKIMNLCYHYCSEPGLMAARHMGAEKAQGEVLCYLDDDSLVSKTWLEGMRESFSREDVVIAGGPCIPKYEVQPPDWVDYFWLETRYGKTNGFLSLVDFGTEFKLIPPVYIYGCNFAIRKRVFLENGGTLPDYYPQGLYQYIGDGESGLSSKLQRKGFLAAYNPRARIDHLIPSSRLSVDYFCWKRYYNGIHASYSHVRQQNGVDRYDEATNTMSFLSSHAIFRRIRPPLGRLKRHILRLLNSSDSLSTTASPEPPEVAAMKSKIEESFHAGYAFHQQSLKTDPKLLEWVLRPNYLGANGKLPI